MKGLVLFLFLIPSIVTPLHAQKERSDLRKGNRNYSKGNFSDAEINYGKALDKNSNSGKASFNLGDALYRQERYQESASAFTAAAQTESTAKINSGAFYNLGNAMVDEGNYSEAIEAYKKSLRIDPENHQAKYNLAWAMDQKRKEEEQKKENSEKNDDQDKKDKQEPGNNNQPDKDSQRGEEKSGEQQKMKKEEADRILAALSANDEKVREKVNKEKVAASKVKTKINW